MATDAARFSLFLSATLLVGLGLLLGSQSGGALLLAQALLVRLEIGLVFLGSLTPCHRQGPAHLDVDVIASDREQVLRERVDEAVEDPLNL
jgi:hypothetical protein